MPHKSPLKILDQFKIRTLAYICSSPDKQKAIVGVNSTNVKEQRNETTLWIYRYEDQSFKQLTVGPSDGKADWIDNDAILFTASKRSRQEEKKDELFPKTCFYSISVTGGEPKLQAKVNGVVFGWKLNSNGKRMVLSFSPHPNCHKGEIKIWEKSPRPTYVNKSRFKMDDLGMLPDKLPGIYTIRIKKNQWDKPKPLVDEPEYWDASPFWLDDTRVLFHRWHANKKESIGELIIAYLEGPKGPRGTFKKDEKKLPLFEGDIHGFEVSPDGKQVAVVGNADIEKGSFLPTNIYLRSTDPDDKEYHRLTDTHGKMGLQITMSDILPMSYDNAPLRWSGNQCLVSLHSVEGETKMIKIDTDNGEQTVLAGKNAVVHCFDIINDDILYGMGGHKIIDELYLLSKEDSPVSDLNEKIRPKFHITPQHWRFESEPGVSIDVRLWVTDAQLKSKKKSLPLVVYIHGGPQLQIGEGLFFEFLWLAHQGYPVVMCNPRGSTGYGAEHGTGIFGNWGDRDVFDMVALCKDTLSRFPQFDAKRLFCAGGSYGGYMTNMLLTRHPGLFRAGITQRSISNFISFSGTSDFADFFPSAALGLENIWENPQRAWDLSPISKIQNLTDPLLIIHSDNDLRCPISQAEELFNALIAMGKKINEEVRFVIFHQESHGLSRAGKPENRSIRLKEVLNWIKKHDVKVGKKNKKSD
ncbi:MAG: hypothetical protein B6244_10970 [Candidatus Cloacimonetes bacterium 4572_55]|nr:MAG: hypothetical protein B6244_10970 [Candidatus Cloacimonetes bacterium 4572_55]